MLCVPLCLASSYVNRDGCSASVRVCYVCVNVIECPAWVRVLVFVSVCMCVPSCASCPITCLHMYVYIHTCLSRLLYFFATAVVSVTAAFAPDRSRGLHAELTPKQPRPGKKPSQICIADLRIKKARGAPAKCPHGRRRSRCTECGGSALCQHGRHRHQCSECQTLADIAGLDVNKVMSCGLAPRLLPRRAGVHSYTPVRFPRHDVVR